MLELRVAGMACSGCVKAVTTAIDRVVPGAEVRVDLPNGLVQVDGALNRQTVAEAIEDAGFAVLA